MPEHFSPKHIPQLVLYELLREFLALRAALLELASDELESTPIDQNSDALHPLPGEQRADAEYWLRPASRSLVGSRSCQSALQHEIPATPGASGLSAQLLGFGRVVRVS